MAQVSVFFFTLAGGVGVDQAAAALDDVDLGWRDARMLFDAVDVGEPDQRQARSPARP